MTDQTNQAVPRPGKKIPMRQCLGCNEHRPKRELWRVVRPPDGAPVSFDPTGRRSGRGAYLCPDVKCLRRVHKSRRLEQVLECTIPDETWAQMEEELCDHENN